MPIFTTPISSQNQASSPGFQRYPATPNLSQYGTYGDNFYRNAINFTGATTLYSTTIVGTGSFAIQASSRGLLLTSATLNDDVSTFTLLNFSRLPDTFVNTSQLTMDIIFSLNSTASNNVFLGLLNSQSAITANPTTAQHMGVLFNDSTSANLFLSSSDGTTQTTTDSGVAMSTTTFYRLNISWTGNNAAVLSLFSGPNRLAQTTLLKTQTVTALSSADALPFHMFIKTTTTAAKSLVVYNWQVTLI